jgi:D-3-phosphoglycerate dehydrogenase / 2-oxoglutarate reductase
MSTYRILVADPISERGIEALRAESSFEVEVKVGLDEAGLVEAMDGVHGLIVRSGVQVTARVIEAAPGLRVIGRAGVGVDNIDIGAATARGVVVMNTPAGNTISTAEHAFSLMTALARRIPQAHASVAGGRWERGKFKGTELNGKTLAILGMGRIGSEVATRALAFGMRVLAYDPYLTVARARSLRVELVEDLDAAVGEADFVSLHMPLTEETHHMISAERLALMKPTARIVNCARGGLVDEVAALAALESGRLAGLALDVFEVEPPSADHPLLGRADVVLTPHLGASTAEAQETVGIEIAQAVADHLLHGSVVNAVNTPNVDPETLRRVGPYLEFAEVLGKLVAQIAPPHAEVLRINYSGRLADMDTALVSRGALRGYLSHGCDPDQVNLINCMGVAEKRGLRFTESRMGEPGQFTDLVEVVAGSGENQATIAGSFFGGDPRVVMINGRHVEAKPHKGRTFLLLENMDRPGMIGLLGTLLGRHGINIASMTLSRDTEGGKAMTLLSLDSSPPPAVVAELHGTEGISVARVLETS